MWDVWTLEYGSDPLTEPPAAGFARFIQRGSRKLGAAQRFLRTMAWTTSDLNSPLEVIACNSN